MLIVCFIADSYSFCCLSFRFAFSSSVSSVMDFRPFEDARFGSIFSRDFDRSLPDLIKFPKSFGTFNLSQDDFLTSLVDDFPRSGFAGGFFDKLVGDDIKLRPKSPGLDLADRLSTLLARLTTGEVLIELLPELNGSNLYLGMSRTS